MNTPKTPKPLKRWKPPNVTGRTLTKSGTSSSGIYNPDIALRFANIVAGFVQLEEFLAPFMAVLLGSKDEASAKYVLRTIKNPKARIDLMKALLHESPNSVQLDRFYDDVIEEFIALNGIRNSYVHGIWWTHESGVVYLNEFLDPLSMVAAREINVAELDGVLNRTQELVRKLIKRTYQDLYGPPKPQ